jgi:hypothetical protein
MRNATWVSVRARAVLDRAALPLPAIVQGHDTGGWNNLTGRTVMVNGQRLSVCIVDRQILWVWTEEDGTVTIALMEEVSRANIERGKHSN